eukprot:CAMPEP_0206260954 /NCGR_PEP_ID=MMETSP0047_2-20121206/27378_1 /ASSEMBLY_ACC=CAM_ASM_000192 /TAXON_ID=195065 /ORGANISM="Chroomonas mesostigmatica_cf, Strain CCMP1168" /LENGTH=89 /DNA_ID=CAMNT_0053688099 /DNA_START=31 /DNA_END=296 /DNA_ORIENTATION=-
MTIPKSEVHQILRAEYGDGETMSDVTDAFDKYFHDQSKQSFIVSPHEIGFTNMIQRETIAAMAQSGTSLLRTVYAKNRVKTLKGCIGLV